MEFRYFVFLKFSANILKLFDDINGVQAFTASQTYFSLYLEECRIVSTAKELLDIFFNHLSPANRTLCKWCHCSFLLILLSIQSAESGLYTVIRTAYPLVSLKPQTL